MTIMLPGKLINEWITEVLKLSEQYYHQRPYKSAGFADHAYSSHLTMETMA